MTLFCHPDKYVFVIPLKNGIQKDLDPVSKHGMTEKKYVITIHAHVFQNDKT